MLSRRHRIIIFTNTKHSVTMYCSWVSRLAVDCHQESQVEPGVVVHDFNTRTLMAEAGFCDFKASLAYKMISRLARASL